VILILNGPNLNLLGQREPTIYGTLTYTELNNRLADFAQELGVAIEVRQSNHEGILIDWVQGAAGEGVRGIVLNPGALAHYSYALADAIRSQPLPVVEVHLSRVHAREAFRAQLVTGAAATGVISGLGISGYLLALRYLHETVSA
jgi:3-dehydroquinate dehydratase-2